MASEVLVTPGPAPLPPQVRKALSRAPVHHRSAEFMEAFSEMQSGLKTVFKTGNPVLVLCGAGSAAMEAAAKNTLVAGQRALVSVTGVFGQRWAYILKSLGVEADILLSKPGMPCDPDELEKLLAAHPRDYYSAFFCTHVETSTGVLNPLREMLDAVRRHSSALTVADVISSLAVEELDTDGWGIDIAVGSSSKGMMNMAGFGFMSMSPRAVEAAGRHPDAGFYFNASYMLKMLEQNQSPFTMPSQLVEAQNEALDIISSRGLESIWEYNAETAKQVRRLADKSGFEIFSSAPANGVTALKPSADIDTSVLVDKVKERANIQLANGQQDFKGKIFRVAHMGYIKRADSKKAVEEAALAVKEMTND